MNAPDSSSSVRYCGRIFTAQDIALVRQIIASHPQDNRVQLARRLCQTFQWLRPDGRLREMSCRVAMLRMHRDGLIGLPSPKTRNGNHRPRVQITSASDPCFPLACHLNDLEPLRFLLVQSPADSALWNQLIHRYHYLGYKTLPGAQIRYLVFSGPHLLAALGFAASAWKVAPRDLFIGWSHPQRVKNLHRIVNNARFLILPWIRIPHLASKILAAVAKRLPLDWLSRYGYSPLLLETFVDKERFHGTCYKAANWILVGQTQGRGKLDRLNLYALPIKHIFLYPLHKQFRQLLCL